MAVMMITDNITWHSSAAILAFVTERLDISGLFPEYKQEFWLVEEGWQALDLSRMDNQALKRVGTIVSQLISQVMTNGPTAHGGEAHYKGLLARLDDLQQLLQAATSSA